MSGIGFSFPVFPSRGRASDAFEIPAFTCVTFEAFLAAENLEALFTGAGLSLVPVAARLTARIGAGKKDAAGCCCLVSLGDFGVSAAAAAALGALE